jgi:hypothetical protein
MGVRPVTIRWKFAFVYEHSTGKLSVEPVLSESFYKTVIEKHWFCNIALVFYWVTGSN